ncbi:hypothetical protein EMIT0215P_230045 [Pseudomonas serboccidentalis]
MPHTLAIREKRSLHILTRRYRKKLMIFTISSQTEQLATVLKEIFNNQTRPTKIFFFQTDVQILPDTLEQYILWSAFFINIAEYIFPVAHCFDAHCLLRIFRPRRCVSYNNPVLNNSNTYT